MQRFFETTKNYGAPITGTASGLQDVPRSTGLAAPFVTIRTGIESAAAIGDRVRLVTMEGDGVFDRRRDDRAIREHRDSCLKAISEYPLRMTLSWDELRKSTREI